MMKLTMLKLLFFLLGNASSGNLDAKFCAGSGGYFGECSARENCQEKSFSFSKSCGFESVCCERQTKRHKHKPDVPNHLNATQSKISSCGLSSLQPLHKAGAKVKRSVAKPGHFPWMVSFVYQQKSEPGGNFCGGVLISPRHVLSAGHCFAGVDPDILGGVVGVRVGLADISRHPGDQPKIQKVQIHPQFRNTSGPLSQPSHDIALITLDREVPSSATVGQICLPEHGRRKEKIVRSVIAGWGATSSDQLQSVDQLRFGQVELVHREKCQQMYDNWGASKVVIEKGMICAGGKKVDACAGDSGAPLMVQQADKHWVVAGLVSFGPSKCGSHVPGVYVKVTQYLPWIGRMMGSQNSFN